MFEECGIHFSVQRSRLTGTQRSFTSSAFVSGNLQFVYKNCAQLKDIHQQNDLNDVLFSHCHHPNSGIAFELLFSVIAHQPDDFVCPICLYQPVAPRMTHCGHIFCADCIQALSVMCSPVRCPVCYEELGDVHVVRADLRLYPKLPTYTFRRVIRSRRNCVCFLADDSDYSALPFASSDSAKFCRFMLADVDYAKKLIDLEKRAIRTQIQVYEEYPDEIKNQMLEGVKESVDNEEVDSETGPRFLLPRNASELGVFYQEANGRLIFLDPLSTKMLRAHFTSIAEAPDVLEFPVLKENGFVVDQRFRKWMPLLGHLPTGADVRLVLGDLSGIVSQDVLSTFAEALEAKTKPDDDDMGNQEEEEVRFTDEDFPELVSSAVKKPTRSSSSPGAWAAVQLTSPSPMAEDFPALTQTSPRPARKPSAWASFKPT